MANIVLPKAYAPAIIRFGDESSQASADQDTYPLQTKFVLDFASGGKLQSFPVLKNEVLTYFPTATNIVGYLMNETSGNLIEGNGGPAMTPSGTPQYGLLTPFNQSSKKGIAFDNSTAAFTCANTTAMDPNGGSITLLAAARLRTAHGGGGPYIIAGKGTASGAGWRVFFNTSEQLNAYVSDGTNTLTVTTSDATGYGRGVYHIIAVTMTTTGGANGKGQVSIFTGEGTTTGDVPAAFNWAAFTNASAAQIGYLTGVGAYHGSIAYVCAFNGTITRAEYDAWMVEGTSGQFAGFTFTPSSYNGVNIGGFDLRDTANPIVRKHRHSAVPLDARYGHLGLAALSASQNNVYGCEAMETWTADAGLTVTGQAGADPGCGYDACLLNKTTTTADASLSASLYAAVLNGPYMFGCWMWTSGTQHLATIELVLTGDGAGTYSTTVMLTGTPQWVSVVTGKYTYSAGTTGTVKVSPVEIGNIAATGTCYVWGAQACGVADTAATFPPSYAPYSQIEGSTRAGSFSGTGAAFGTKTGYIGITLTAEADTASNQVRYVYVGDGVKSGAAILMDSSLDAMIVEMLDSTGSIIANSQKTLWASSYALAHGQRRHMTMSWDPDIGKIRLSVNGMATAGGIEDSTTVAPPVWPDSFASDFKIGYDASDVGYQCNAIIERIEFGAADGLVSPRQMKLYSDATVGKKFRIICVGDSITGFYDGYTQWLGKALGDDAIVMNCGYSGNLLAGSATPLADILQRVNAEMVNRRPDAVLILAGVNDILFNGFTGAQTIEHYRRVIERLSAMGVSTYACTILPFANVHGWAQTWDSTKETYAEEVNNWLRSVPEGVSGVVDTKKYFADTDGVTFKNQLWYSGGSFKVGNHCSYGGNLYVCTSGGTSGATAPTGTGTGISDGGCTWDYVSAGVAYTSDGLHPTSYHEGHGDPTLYGGAAAVGQYIAAQLWSEGVPEDRSLTNIGGLKFPDGSVQVSADPARYALSFPGASADRFGNIISAPHISHGYFWGELKDLGAAMFWDAWAAFHDTGYLVSDGYGGAHALLWGPVLSNDRLVMQGDISTYEGGGNPSVVSFGSVDGPSPDEWGHHAIALLADPLDTTKTYVVTYWNGIIVGVTLFGTASKHRGTGSVSNGNGVLFVGGSSHITMNGKIAALRAWDQFNPIGDFWPAAPERSFGSTGGNTLMPVDFLSSYTNPYNFQIPDLGRGADAGDGYGRRVHPGQFHNGPESDGNAGGNYNDYSVISASPMPVYVRDDYMPYGKPGDLTNTGETIGSVVIPSGCRIYDSFNREGQNFAWKRKPALGMTDGGSLGRLTWNQTTTPTGTIARQPFGCLFGILNGRAVSLNPGMDMAYVDNGQADMDVRVSRMSVDSGTGIAFRIQDASNFRYVATLPRANVGSLYHGAYVSGSVVENANHTPTNMNWLTLRVTTVGNVITYYVDDGAGGWEQVFQETLATLNTATKVGIYTLHSQPYYSNFWRADDFTVY